MVGSVFRVVFTRNAQLRRKQIHAFEQRLNGEPYAHKIQQAINKSAAELEKFPEAHPNYLEHNSGYEVKYTKAKSYKILFQVLKKVNVVIILTIRNDAENPDNIRKEI